MNGDPLGQGACVKRGKDTKITQRNYLPAAGPVAQLEQERKSTQVISCTFIQLKPAGDIIGNHQLAGIRWTTREDSRQSGAESGKALMLDSIRNTPREREPAGALYASGEQRGEETGEPKEALRTDRDRISEGMGEPEEGLYSNRGGSIRGAQETKKAPPPGGDRREQQRELRSRMARGWVSAHTIRNSRVCGEILQDARSWTSPTVEKDSSGTYHVGQSERRNDLGRRAAVDVDHMKGQTPAGS
ncbi:hypothetical protein Y1Q_0018892 [Alligator mississippiensis]|uniref:Uncharacterized protein n=1 Tax=Alligator mississippiensis TaxID=8496 RepID=A0A151M312_ALLMI|nr:hypothetical protein Y1Q_0018892 [Alligator mississippiensis]